MNARPKKSFGQHFLHDRLCIERIVAAIAPRDQDFLVEIGPEVDLEAMLRHMLRLSGIYVKDISSKVDCRALRIAVRTAEDNDLFLDCWRKCYPLAVRPATSAGRA